MAEGTFMEALELANSAWSQADTMRETAIEADASVATALQGQDVLITGYTTHRYEPLAPSDGPEERVRTSS